MDKYEDGMLGKPGSVVYTDTTYDGDGLGRPILVQPPKPAVQRDLYVLEECRETLGSLPAKDAERVIKYLQDWNKSRPAEDT